MIETMKFNVGGKSFEVSRSLLKTIDPNTLLGEKVEEQWQEDPEEDIFFERDGSIFKFVLGYLRDGKVDLPMTATKEMLVTELEFYGINYEEDRIREKPYQLSKCFDHIRNGLADLNHMADELDAEHRCIKHSIGIVHAFVAFNSRQKDSDMALSLENERNLRALRQLVGFDEAKKRTNAHLKRFGLRVKYHMESSVVLERLDDINVDED